MSGSAESRVVGRSSRAGPLAVMAPALLAAVLAAPGTASADDLHYVEGLRARHLYRLAESYCRDRLADPDLDARQQADLAAEWIRTLAQQALHANPDGREELWLRVEDVLRDFDRRWPEHPRALLVRFQASLAYLARAEVLRQEAEIMGWSPESRDALLEALRVASRNFEELARDLERAIPRAPQRADPDQRLTGDELFALQRHLQVQLARVYRNRGQVYPAGSDDRVAALAMALDRLEQPLTQLQQDDPLAGRIYLEQLRAHRLLGSFSQAHRLLDPLESEAWTDEVRDQAAAEAMRLALAEGQLSRALSQANDPGHAQHAGAEWWTARLEVYLAAWKQAEGNRDAQAERQWQSRAMETVEHLEAAFGPYWGRRAELLLVRHAGGESASGNLAILQRTAENFYRRGQLEDAVAIYEQAARQAATAGQPQAAFELTYLAARVEQERGRHGEAARRLRRLSLEQPDHDDAPAVHLLATWNLAQVLEADPAAGETYEAWLAEHLQTWPAAPPSNSARLWLSRLQEARGEWQAAIDVLQDMLPEGAGWDEGVSRWERCWIALGNQEDAAGVVPDRALTWIDARVFGDERTWPDTWTESAAAAAVSAARLRLHLDPIRADEAEALLRAVVQDAAETPAAAPARILLPRSLALQPGREREALEALAAIPVPSGSPDDWLELVGGLDRYVQGKPHRHPALSPLIQGTTDRALERVREPDAAQRTVQRVRFEAMAAGGREEEARDAYRDLARSAPRDAVIQRGFGRFLLESENAASHREALDQWRRLARVVRPDTPLWYEAKWSVAKAQSLLGEQEEAANLLRYVQATSRVEQSAWQARYAELLEACSGE